MNTIVIHATDQQMTLINEFLKAHHLKSRVLSEDDKEDIVMSRLIQETDFSDIVDTDDFMRKLRD